MTAVPKKLRILSGILGFAGLVAAAFIVRDLYATFSFWRLPWLLLTLWGTAKFLFFAFHREPYWQLPGGSDGAASAPVPWPAPSEPPSLSAGAAAAIPEDSL